MTEYNDNELLDLVSEGSEEAYNILYKKYSRLIESTAKKYLLYGKKVGLEYNDLVNEGMIGLSEAINSYKDHMDASFFTFVTACIKNQVFSILASHGRKKHNALNDSYSLDYVDEDSQTSFIDFIKCNDLDPSIKVELEENKKNLYEVMHKELSDFEKEVFDLKMSGLDNKEIAIILNKSYKSIATALDRIKQKLRKVISTVDL